MTERCAFSRLANLQAKDSLGVAKLFACVQQALPQQDLAGGSEKSSCSGPTLSDQCQGPQAEVIQSLLDDFATATTAKDVSIMLTIQRVEYSHNALRTLCTDDWQDRLSGSNAAVRTGTTAAWWQHRILGDEMDILPSWLDLAAPAGLSTLDGRAACERWAYSLAICDLDPKVRR